MAALPYGWKSLPEHKRLAEQIFGIELKTRKGTVLFDTDEHVRHDATMENRAALWPAFQKYGTVNTGNASGVNDGGAAVVLATGEAVRRLGLAPLARLVAAGHTGGRPGRSSR